MAEFDSTKGAFYLVAMIIGTMMLMMLLGMGTCTWLSVTGHPMPVCSDLKDFAKEIITMAFTAAIAFAGGRMSAPHPPPPRLPERDDGVRVMSVVPQHRRSKPVPKYQGKDVQVRDLKKEDAKFGSRFNEATPQVIVKHSDGREEVVAKDQLEGGDDQGQGAGAGQAKPGGQGGQGSQGGQGRQST